MFRKKTCYLPADNKFWSEIHTPLHRVPKMTKFVQNILLQIKIMNYKSHLNNSNTTIQHVKHEDEYLKISRPDINSLVKHSYRCQGCLGLNLHPQ